MLTGLDGVTGKKAIDSGALTVKNEKSSRSPVFFWGGGGGGGGAGWAQEVKKKVSINRLQCPKSQKTT